jgi:hypothetical protein
MRKTAPTSATMPVHRRKTPLRRTVTTDASAAPDPGGQADSRQPQPVEADDDGRARVGSDAGRQRQFAEAIVAKAAVSVFG